MIAWFIAAAAGIALALLSYRPSKSSGALPWASFLLRFVAWTTALALLFDAPVGFDRLRPRVYAVDASSSMIRGGEPAAFAQTAAGARPDATNGLWLFGDSVRSADALPAAPRDSRSRLRDLVDRASLEGRPVAVFTDGELDDPQFAADLPAGSTIILHERPERPDIAVADVRGEFSGAVGDTIELQVQLLGSATASGSTELRVFLDDRALGVQKLDGAGEQTVTARFMVGGDARESDREGILRVVVASAGDAEPRNDTLAVPFVVSSSARPVFVSTSPDYDARFSIAALRASTQLPVRGFWRIAPGQWRVDGSFAAVAESEVRAAIREAPTVVIHGDTAHFGDPRSATRGALVLHPTNGSAGGDWFASDAPISPISPSLAAAPWDSLPPLTVVGEAPRGDEAALVVRQARRGEPRPVIVLSGGRRRVTTVAATGFWRWKFRGGAAAAVYDALYGSIFDWAGSARPDSRPAAPAHAVIREGDRIPWRRGAVDSVVTVVLARIDGSDGVDSVTLRFPAGEMMTTSDPLPAGIYQARMDGATAILAVNASRELLPRAPTIRAGDVGRGVNMAGTRGLRTSGMPYALIIVALCAEWLLRRRRGDR